MTRSVSIKVLWGIIFDIRCFIISRLPHIGAVAVRDGIHNPFSQILGRRVEVKHLVDIGMVNLPMNQALDLGEIAHHAIAVEFLGAAIHVNLPVVAMQVLTFALVVEIELMAGGYF